MERTNKRKEQNKSSGLAETLFSDYRRRILALLLLRSDEDFHVREISRLTGVPAGSLHRELKLLTDAGLLSRHALGNQVRYHAERGCPIFHELSGIFRKASGLADVIRSALQPLSPGITAAFIIGSVAKGEERATSDVDVCVIGTASFADVVVALADMNQKLGREINPVVMPYEQFTAKLAAGEQFATRIMSEPKLFLIGDEHDIGNSLS
jgi:predicted nucleotidyltransferase